MCRITISCPGRGSRVPASGGSSRALALALATSAVVALAGPAAEPAQASVTTSWTGPVRVVIAGPTVDVNVATLSTTTIGTSPLHIVVLQGPGVSLWAGGPTAQLTIKGTLVSRTLALGAQAWTALDAGDDRATTVPVLVLRQSRIATATFTSPTPGHVWASLRLQHYDPSTGTWAASKRSPIQVQTWRSGRWTSLATLSTDNTTGIATGTFPLPTGTQQIRLVRPEGATVTGMTSTFTVRVR